MSGPNQSLVIGSGPDLSGSRTVKRKMVERPEVSSDNVGTSPERRAHASSSLVSKAEAVAGGEVPSPSEELEVVLGETDGSGPSRSDLFGSGLDRGGETEASTGNAKSTVSIGTALRPQPVEPAWFEDEREESTLLPPPRTAPAPQKAVEEDVRLGDGAVRERVRLDVVGLLVLGVLVLVCVSLAVAVAAKTQTDSAAAAREAAAFATAPATSLGSAAAGSTIVVVSDQAEIRRTGTGADQRWPQMLAERLGAKVVTLTDAGAGYGVEGGDGETFTDLAEAVPATTEVVIFVGGGVDTATPSLALARAATQAFAAASMQAPEALVIAVGPLYRPSGTDETVLTRIRTALKSSARITGVRWVDPVRTNWLPEVAGAADLTPAVERSIASRMEALVAASVG